MPDKLIRKGFNILEEAEEIRQKKQTDQPQKESIDFIRSRLIYAIPMHKYPDVPRYFASNIWRDLLLKTREFPKHEFQDDISELRQEVNTLKLMVKSLNKTIESSNSTIDELSKEIRQKQEAPQIRETYLDNICKAYTEMVIKIDVVKEIYIIEENNVITCWTIIEAEPFDSNLRAPIYDAQVKIYQEIEKGIALDFHVLNLSELNDRKELKNILPPNSSLIWQR